MRKYTNGQLRLAAVKNFLARSGGFATFEAISSGLKIAAKRLRERLDHFCSKGALVFASGHYFPLLSQGELKIVLGKLGRATLESITLRAGFPEDQVAGVEPALSRLVKKKEVILDGSFYTLAV